MAINPEFRGSPGAHWDDEVDDALTACRLFIDGIRQQPPKPNDVEVALANMRTWMTQPQFTDYHGAVHSLIGLLQDDGFPCEEREEAGRELVDSFCRQMKFGTGGRRGRVGIGPNRVNPYLAALTAQGHADFVMQSLADAGVGSDTIRRRGIVIAGDVRVFRRFYPAESRAMRCYREILAAEAGMKDFGSRSMGQIVACVYAANGLIAYLANEVRPTPWLSYHTRFMHQALNDALFRDHGIAGTAGGTVNSSSHNLPDNNGQKYYLGGPRGDSDGGGQITPPVDAQLVAAGDGAAEIRHMSFDAGVDAGRIYVLEANELARLDDAYYMAQEEVFHGYADNRFTPVPWAMHAVNGTADVTLLPLAVRLGFKPPYRTSSDRHDPSFPDAFASTPNPEVEATFRCSVQPILEQYTDAHHGFIFDPDADRAGLELVRRRGNNRDYLPANDNDEIAVINLFYTLEKWYRLGRLHSKKIGIVVNTVVSTGLAERIVSYYRDKFGRDLRLLTHLVGFKYTGEIIGSLRDGVLRGLTRETFNDAGITKEDLHRCYFIISHEEGEGGLVGDCGSVDKDGANVCISLNYAATELAAEGRTLCDYLQDIYKQVGYSRTGLEPLVLDGAVGEDITRRIQGGLRGARDSRVPQADAHLEKLMAPYFGSPGTSPPKCIGDIPVRSVKDYWQGQPFAAETELESRNVLVFTMADYKYEGMPITNAKVVVRPSGTEPKLKIATYVPGPELPDGASDDELDRIKATVDQAWRELLDQALLTAYDLTGLEIPSEPQDRLELVRLYFNMPTSKKLDYFRLRRTIFDCAEEIVVRGNNSLETAHALAAGWVQRFSDTAGIEQIADSFRLQLEYQLANAMDEALVHCQAQILFGAEQGTRLVEQLLDKPCRRRGSGNGSRRSDALSRNRGLNAAN